MYIQVVRSGLKVSFSIITILMWEGGPKLFPGLFTIPLICPL